MKKLTADEGNVFALKDRTAVYDNILYLSDIDSADRYIQLTEDEGKALKEELEKKAMEHANASYR